MTTKMHRVVLYVLDLNLDNTPEGLKSEFSSLKYPEYVHVGEIKTTDIGEWHDKHPLNLPGGNYEEYFKGE